MYTDGAEEQSSCPPSDGEEQDEGAKDTEDGASGDGKQDSSVRFES